MLIYHSTETPIAGVWPSVEGEVIVGGRLMRGREANNEMFGLCWVLPHLSKRHIMCSVHLGESQPGYHLPMAAVTGHHSVLNIALLDCLTCRRSAVPNGVPGLTWRCGQACVSSEGLTIKLCPRLPSCQRRLSAFACGSFSSSWDVWLHTQLSLLLCLPHLKVFSDFTGPTQIIQATSTS